MSGVILRLAACSVLVGACSAAGGADSLPYLDEPGFRRAELEASLVNPHNEYSELRLQHYESGGAGDWARLPEWNPAVETIAAGELDAPRGAVVSGAPMSGEPLALPDGVTSADDPALLALGEAAFNRYPVQLTPYLGVALASREAASRYGVWVDASGGVGGLVRARMTDGSVVLAETCSTCHAARASQPGVPNASLDVGAAILASQGPLLDPSLRDAIAAWGPGRLDVTTGTGTEPVRIPDLRPVRWLTYLQADATVHARDVFSLAIRIETLVITSNEQAVRPPRIVSLALAAYITSLGGALPSIDAAAAASPQGASLFADHCAGCHAPPGLTGEPVPLAVVGTDPHLGLSPVRGTGTYRVPSLHGAGTRGPLLHDASLPSLAAMFDPARTSRGFEGRLHGSGAVPGHLFGLDLSPDDRAALIAYLQEL